MDGAPGRHRPLHARQPSATTCSSSRSRSAPVRSAWRAGRTVRGGSSARRRLPTRKVLQSKFPRRKVQGRPGDLDRPGPHPAQLGLAHELSARQRAPGPAPGSRPEARRIPGRTGGPSRDRPRSPPRSRGRSGDGRPVPGPASRTPATIGASIAQVRKHVAVLEHQVPVDPVPAMLQEHESSASPCLPPDSVPGWTRPLPGV